jgi:hypothetical protein
VAWAEWIRHQEITDPGDLAGVAAALWAVLIPQEWGSGELESVAMPLDQVLDPSPAAQDARLALVEQRKQQGAQGLLARRAPRGRAAPPGAAGRPAGRMAVQVNMCCIG